MQSEEIVKKLLDVIQASIDDFCNSMAAYDRLFLSEVEGMLKDLDLKDGVILNNAKNLSLIGKVKQKVDQIVRSPKFNNSVKSLLASLVEITAIQHDYFNSIHDDYNPHEKLKELQLQTISDTVDALKGSGMKQPIINRAQQILKTNIRRGKSYSELLAETREYLTANDGPMVRYAKQITTGTLNTYAATYNKLVSSDLGLTWHAYVGVIIKTSRPFCVACCQKEYIHESEFDEVIHGDFPEFREAGGKIDDNTGLPSGMMAGTNISNFQIRCGGRDNNCNHQLMPVSRVIVPKMLRDKFPD